MLELEKEVVTKTAERLRPCLICSARGGTYSWGRKAKGRTKPANQSGETQAKLLHSSDHYFKCGEMFMSCAQQKIKIQTLNALTDGETGLYQPERERELHDEYRMSTQRHICITSSTPQD